MCCARLALSAGLLAGAAPAFAAAVYQYDDGQTDTAIGPPSSFSADPQTGWGNYFTAVPGGEVITNVSIAFGPTWPTRGPVNVYLFDDPDDDFNPGNATLLASTTLTPATIGLSAFNDFPITPTAVSGGFFVLATTDTAKGQDRPAAQDTSAGAPTNRSWLIYNPRTVGINTTTLSANAYFQPAANATVIDGVFMIRANGVPEPTALSLLAAPLLALCRRRR
jgi:hypothetical protein